MVGVRTNGALVHREHAFGRRNALDACLHFGKRTSVVALAFTTDYLIDVHAPLLRDAV